MKRGLPPENPSRHTAPLIESPSSRASTLAERKETPGVDTISNWGAAQADALVTIAATKISARRHM